MYAQSVLQSLQAFSQRLMQQMANPVQLTEAHLALTSILTGLLLILHITHFFFHSHSFLWILRCGSVFKDVQMVADKYEGQRNHV